MNCPKCRQPLTEVMLKAVSHDTFSVNKDGTIPDERPVIMDSCKTAWILCSKCEEDITGAFIKKEPDVLERLIGLANM